MDAPRKPLAWLGAYPEALLGTLALAIFVVWSSAEGGFFVTSSGPGALFVLGLLVVAVIVVVPRAAPVQSGTALVLILLGAYVAWTFASIAWAGNPGEAWDAANRTLLYALVFGLFAVLPWRAGSAAWVLGLWTVAMAGVGIAVLASAAGAADPLESFVGGVFAAPTGYHNATAALFAAPCLPALVLAANRSVPAVGRGALLAAAGVCFELALLPQSRGWLIVFPLVALLALVISPGRARLLVFAVPVAVAGLLASGPLLDVFDAVQRAGALGGALDDALAAVLWSAAALFAIGTLAALADRKLPRSQGVSRGARLAVGATAVLGGVAALVLVLGETGNPVDWAGDRWDDFKGGEPQQGFGGSRLGDELGSNRYDFWRVAVDAWQEDPIAGVGAGNFAVEYLQGRDSGEEPLHPHSLPLAVLSQEGVVGALIFTGFLVAGLLAAAQARIRAPSPLDAAVVAGCLLAFAYWFGHSTGDWLSAFPAVTGPAFAFLGMAVGMRPGPAGLPARPRAAKPGRARRIAVVAVASGAVVVAAASFALPVASQLDTDAAVESWRADSEGAFDRLERAQDLNPLSPRPALFEGAIAIRVGDYERAEAAFTEALDRVPESWYAQLELAALDMRAGRFAPALQRLEEAAVLNPRETIVDLLRRRAEARRPYPLAEIDTELARRVCARVAGPASTDEC